MKRGAKKNCNPKKLQIGVFFNGYHYQERMKSSMGNAATLFMRPGCSMQNLNRSEGADPGTGLLQQQKKTANSVTAAPSRGRILCLSVKKRRQPSANTVQQDAFCIQSTQQMMLSVCGGKPAQQPRMNREEGFRFHKKHINFNSAQRSRIKPYLLVWQ